MFTPKSKRVKSEPVEDELGGKLDLIFTVIGCAGLVNQMLEISALEEF